MSIRAGHGRGGHVTAIRGDGVNPDLLVLRRVVSEDALRRGLGTIDETAGVAWLREHLEPSVLPLLQGLWILDVDTTVKARSWALTRSNRGGRRLLPTPFWSPACGGFWTPTSWRATTVHSNHTLAGFVRLLDRLATEHG